MRSVTNQAQLDVNGRTLEPVYSDTDLQKRAEIVFTALSFGEVRSISTVGQAVFAELENHYAEDNIDECGGTTVQKTYLKIQFDNSDDIRSAIFV